MNNEEFQKLVLENFKTINQKLTVLENGQNELKKDISFVKDKVRIIEEQTKGLTEFKQAIKDSASDLMKKIS